MILIADGGSTKVDWIALDKDKSEVFRVKSLGLNPAVVTVKDLVDRIKKAPKLIEFKDKIDEVYFYGAGCGTPKPIATLQSVIKSIFVNASVSISEDMLAAVYASTGKKPAIVCILGTGSNSCYFNGNNIETSHISLGYTIMDEASGNYFGKALLRDYFYKKMPKRLREKFKTQFNLDTDFIKHNLYKEANPNMYLANFAKFMLDTKDNPYIKRILEKGFSDFFQYHVLSYNKPNETPIYFIGSIAFYFRDALEKVAKKHNLKITDIIQRPIDNLLDYHRKHTN